MRLQSLWNILTEPVSVIFLIVASAGLVVNLATWRRQIDADAPLASTMLFAAWWFTKIVAWLTDWPTARSFYPITDLIQGLAVLHLCENRRARWKDWLLGIFVAKLLTEIWFRNGDDIAGIARYAYRITLDALYFLALIVAASSGGRIVADRLADWMLPGSRRRDLALSRTKIGHH